MARVLEHDLTCFRLSETEDHEVWLAGAGGIEPP
jgi:hypothetical protein